MSGGNSYPWRSPRPTVNDFDATCAGTHVWAGMQWLDGQWRVVVNAELPQTPQNVSRGTGSYHFRGQQKMRIFRIFPRLLKNLLEIEIFVWSARLGQKLHWVSSSFASIISRYFFNKLEGNDPVIGASSSISLPM